MRRKENEGDSSARKTLRPFSAFQAVVLTLVFAAPMLTALAILAAAGKLEPSAAALGALGALVVLFGLVCLLLFDLAAVATILRDDTGGASLQRFFFFGLLRSLAAAAKALQARSRHSLAEANRLVSFHDSVLANLPLPLLTIDPKGIVRQTNGAARTFFGKEANGKAFVSIVRGPAPVEAVDKVLRGERRCVAQFSLAGEVERHFEIVVEALPWEGHAEGAAMVLLHDVTDLVRAEKMRADFVANASHELKTPLASILGFIETLQGPAWSDVEVRERFLVIMFQQAQRMRRLIDDLLSLSRIELREHTPPTEQVAVKQAVDSILEVLQMQAKTKGIVLKIEIPDALPAVVADADELTQVFQNLLSNAIKYGLPDTEVFLSARAESWGPDSMPFATRADCVAVAVADQGEGIAKEHLPRLTERFYRVDAARSRQLGGTGLGLAIVKHIVARHRGAMTIESVVGQGSVFTVFIPAAKGSSRETMEHSVPLA